MGDTEEKEDILSTIGLTCSKLKNLLEKEFKGIKIDGYNLATITTMHIAKMNTEIAKSFIFNVGNYKSKKIEIDQSKGVPEIETIDPKTAVYDLEIIEEMEKIKKILTKTRVLNKKDEIKEKDSKDNLISEKEQEEFPDY